MRLLRILPLLALLAAVALPSSASAASRYKVGIGEQSPGMFTDALYQPLNIKRVRYIVPWDWQREPFQRGEILAFYTAAIADGAELFVHFTASRGCYVDGDYLKGLKHCKLPSVKAYSKSFKAFRTAFPQVKVFGAWNEINHKSQPTYKSPKRAAQFYMRMRKDCRSCTVVAADLLDSSNLSSYAKRFARSAKPYPKVWGLHNYADVNRKRKRETPKLLRTVRGEVWVTETGGIVNLDDSIFTYSLSRAANRLSYMFTLADQYSKKRKGFRSRITRIYPYEWRGEDRSARFDAGIVGPNGEQRPAYNVFKNKLKTRSK